MRDRLDARVALRWPFNGIMLRRLDRMELVYRDSTGTEVTWSPGVVTNSRLRLRLFTEYLKTRTMLLSLHGDTLVEVKTPFRFFASGTCFIDPDGKGIGLLAVWRPTYEDKVLFRFYRL